MKVIPFAMAGMATVGLALIPFRQETVVERLRHDHMITQGYVCQGYDDITCVDSVCNEDGVAYWSISVNGDHLHYNANSRVGPNDLVQVQYLPVEAFEEER